MLHQRSRTKGHHASAIRPLSHGTSVNKHYASVRFCRRSRPTKKFLNVCENFARNVGHVKRYCPFTRSSFCNISQTLRKFRKECFVFFVVWKGLKGHGNYSQITIGQLVNSFRLTDWHSASVYKLWTVRYTLTCFCLGGCANGAVHRDMT